MHDDAPTIGHAGITPADVTELAIAADCDPRTVERRLAGLPVRGRVCRRIDAAIAAWRLRRASGKSEAAG
jgi:hypothetical protein